MRRSRSILVPAALLFVAVAAVPAAARFHFGLARSLPEAGATVPAPAELQLWFTQAPTDGSLSVRLVDAGGELVATEGPKAHTDDAKAFGVRVSRRLAAGAYTVAWRGVGEDGHSVQGEFGFTVTSATSFQEVEK